MSYRHLSKEETRTLTADELRRFRKELSYLPREQLLLRYNELWEIARYAFPNWLPKPRVMQELISIWKVLWKKRR